MKITYLLLLTAACVCSASAYYDCDTYKQYALKKCQTYSGRSHNDCVHRRLKRSQCSDDNNCGECNCNYCSDHDCSDRCSDCCTIRESACDTPYCCHKKCTYQCHSVSCRRTCKSKCLEDVDHEEVVQQNGYAPTNITTIISLHNKINNTNIIDMPIRINTTNVNNLNLTAPEGFDFEDVDEKEGEEEEKEDGVVIPPAQYQIPPQSEPEPQFVLPPQTQSVLPPQGSQSAFPPPPPPPPQYAPPSPQYTPSQYLPPFPQYAPPTQYYPLQYQPQYQPIPQYQPQYSPPQNFYPQYPQAYQQYSQSYPQMNTDALMKQFKCTYTQEWPYLNCPGPNFGQSAPYQQYGQQYQPNYWGFGQQQQPAFNPVVGFGGIGQDIPGQVRPALPVALNPNQLIQAEPTTKDDEEQEEEEDEEEDYEDEDTNP